MIKAILLDCDDTLVDTIGTKIEAMRHAGKVFYNLDIPAETIRGHWGIPYDQMMTALYGHVDTLENAKKNYHSVRDNFPSTIHGDANKVVKNLLGKYVVGMVTSGPRELIEKDMRRHGFPIESMIVQTQEDTDIHKPNPAVFDPILTKLAEQGITKDEVVYVGDSHVDYYAARDAGLHFFAIPDRTTPKEKFESEGAKTISAIEELEEAIKNLP